MKKEFGIGEYPTRDGSRGHVSHIAEKSNGYPLIGYVVKPDGVAFPSSWDSEGLNYSACSSDYDLMREPALISENPP